MKLDGRRGWLDAYFKHVVDAEQRRPGGHLENPRGLGLDLFADQRMQPLTGGEINPDAEPLLKQSLGCHQVQGVEAPTGIMVDKKIDVALGIGLAAGR